MAKLLIGEAALKGGIAGAKPSTILAIGFSIDLAEVVIVNGDFALS